MEKEDKKDSVIELEKIARQISKIVDRKMKSKKYTDVSEDLDSMISKISNVQAEEANAKAFAEYLIERCHHFKNSSKEDLETKRGLPDIKTNSK
jgi:CRISPR/Cas system CSM-associated protein Csm2 small subunit